MTLGLDTVSFQLATGLGRGDSPSFWRPNSNAPMQLNHFIDKAAELCLEEIVISDLRLIERIDYGYLSALRRTAEDRSIGFQLVYSGGRSDHLQDIIRVAEGMGCKLVTFYPEFERPINDDAFQDLLDELVTILTRTLPIAERYGIKIAIAGAGILTLDELLETVTSIEDATVGVCLDPLSALMVLEDPLIWAQSLGSRVVTARISDYQPFAVDYGIGFWSVGRESMTYDSLSW